MKFLWGNVGENLTDDDDDSFQIQCQRHNPWKKQSIIWTLLKVKKSLGLLKKSPTGRKYNIWKKKKKPHLTKYVNQNVQTTLKTPTIENKQTDF